MAVFVGGFAAGKTVDVFEDVVRDFDGGIGNCFAPGFGNTGAALVSHRGIVSWEGCGGDGENLGTSGKKVAWRDGLPGAVGWFPFEAQGRFLFLVGNVFEKDGNGMSPEQKGGLFLLAHFVVGGNPGVDQRVGVAIGVVDPKTGSIGRADTEAVSARFGWEDGAGPIDGKGVWVNLLDFVIGLNVKTNPGVDPFQKLALLVVHFFFIEVSGLQSVFVADAALAPKAANEIGESATMLMLGAAKEIFADGLKLGLGFGGVEGVKHVFRNGTRVVVDDGVLVVLGHGLVDILRQRSDALLSDEGFIVFIGDSLAFVAMTGGAVFGVDFGTVLCSGLKSQSEKEDKPAESHAGDYAKEGADLSRISPSLPFRRREEVWRVDWACDRRGRCPRVA